jgi:two-component system cell cycle response regulator DivK
MKPVVLMIEDNEQNRYLLSFLLSQCGYVVVEAHDGPRGIEAARTASPSVILLDVQLPTMDGYTVARTLRQNPSLGHIPIVAVTSYAMAGDREKALAAGCSGYLEKPINPDTFVAEMEKIMASHVVKS